MPPRNASHRRLPFEVLAWTAGLLVLALTDPQAPPLVDLCLFKRLGLPCPGCGLGHAIAWLFRGEWTLAVQTHPLAPLAVAVLVGRVVSLLRPTVFHHPLSS